tara:strand:+ start:299 stop:565 length:267 start_codon:yes stop_codon:yes gene_type:complete
MPDETPAVASMGQRLLSFGAFWLSVLILIGGGLAVYHRSKVGGELNEFPDWLRALMVTDSVGQFFVGVLAVIFVTTLWSFVFRTKSTE